MTIDEALIYLRIGPGINEDVSKEYNDAVDMAIEALIQSRDQMSSSEKPNKWIPISKETPKENGYYLTTNMFGEVYCDYWCEIEFNRTETVTAWMPLPEPYKAESEE